MEKMRNDMLEMILNSQKGRLSERVTKFLIAQVSNSRLSTPKLIQRFSILDCQRIEVSAQQEHCSLRPEAGKRSACE